VGGGRRKGPGRISRTDLRSRPRDGRIAKISGGKVCAEGDGMARGGCKKRGGCSESCRSGNGGRLWGGRVAAERTG